MFIAAKSNENRAANFYTRFYFQIIIIIGKQLNIVPLLRHEQKTRLIFSNKNIDLKFIKQTTIPTRNVITLVQRCTAISYTIFVHFDDKFYFIFDAFISKKDFNNKNDFIYFNFIAEKKSNK